MKRVKVFGCLLLSVILLSAFTIGIMPNGISFQLESHSAEPHEVLVITEPAGQAIPLFVLSAKIKEFIPNRDLKIRIIQTPPQEDIEATNKILTEGDVDFGCFNVIRGAKLFDNGLKNIRLAGSFLWRSPLIISKNLIEVGDWSALRDKSGVVAGTEELPLFMLTKMALSIRDFNFERENALKSVDYEKVIPLLKAKDTSPDFVILPEPIASNVLSLQTDENWPVRYHVFADLIQSLYPFGYPLGGLWVINHRPYTDDLIYAFEEAIEYLVKPENFSEVSKIVSDGFKAHLNFSIKPETIQEMLYRGNLSLRFKDAHYIDSPLNSLLKKFDLSLDENVFYSRFNYRLMPPPIFMSHLMPHTVGFVLFQEDNMGVSQDTLQKAKESAAIYGSQVVEITHKVRELELQIYDASLDGDTANFESLLAQLELMRREATLTQWEAIQRFYEEIAPEEKELINEYLRKNRLAITTARGF